MKLVKNLIFSGLLASMAFLVTSCKQEMDKAQQLEAEVMKIHDDIMPKMTDLQTAKKELGVALENGADSTKVFEYLSQIEEADEAMMVWMDEYKSPESSASETEKLTYLNLELNRITDVKEKMLKAIQDAGAFSAQFIQPINDTIK